MNVDDEKDPMNVDIYKQDISLLFLDVDGVLNTRDPDKSKRDKSILSLDRTLVERLKLILTSTNIECKICVSSAWRLNKYSLQYLKKRLIAMADIDVEHVIIGQTPSIPFNEHIQNVMDQRIMEIRSYLTNDICLKSKYNVISFCVMDDLDLKDIGYHNFVHINPKYGLTANDSKQILSILNQVPLHQMEVMETKPGIKLLFIAAMEQNYHDMNVERLQIILKKTECTLVITKHEYKQDLYHNSFIVDHFGDITKFVSGLQEIYNVESWAVLDYINVKQKYAEQQQQQLISRRFIEVDPSQGLVLNDVLTTVSILNKWSF